MISNREIYQMQRDIEDLKNYRPELDLSITTGVKFNIVKADFDIDKVLGLFVANLNHNLNQEIEGFSISFYTPDKEFQSLDYKILDNNNIQVYSDEPVDLIVSIKQSVQASHHDHDSDYSKLNHIHTDYSLVGHSHNDYADRTHEHNDYADRTHEHDNYADRAHEHDNYADKIHTHVMTDITDLDIPEAGVPNLIDCGKTNIYSPSSGQNVVEALAPFPMYDTVTEQAGSKVIYPHYMSYCMDFHTLYIFGSASHEGEALTYNKTLFSLRTFNSSSKWAKETDFPYDAIYYPTMIACDNEIIVYGGTTDGGNITSENKSNKMYSYNTSTKVWSIKNSILPELVINKPIYYEKEKAIYLYNFSSYSSNTWKYSIETDEWIKLAATPKNGLHGFSATIMNDKLIIKDGLYMYNNSSRITSDVYVYDIVKNEWKVEYINDTSPTETLTFSYNSELSKINSGGNGLMYLGYNYKTKAMQIYITAFESINNVNRLWNGNLCDTLSEDSKKLLEIDYYGGNLGMVTTNGCLGNTVFIAKTANGSVNDKMNRNISIYRGAFYTENVKLKRFLHVNCMDNSNKHYTGLIGETTISTYNNNGTYEGVRMYIHNGKDIGGHPVAMLKDLESLKPSGTVTPYIETFEEFKAAVQNREKDFLFKPNSSITVTEKLDMSYGISSFNGNNTTFTLDNLDEGLDIYIAKQGNVGITNCIFKSSGSGCILYGVNGDKTKSRYAVKAKSTTMESTIISSCTFDVQDKLGLYVSVSAMHSQIKNCLFAGFPGGTKVLLENNSFLNVLNCEFFYTSDVLMKNSTFSGFISCYAYGNNFYFYDGREKYYIKNCRFENVKIVSHYKGYGGGEISLENCTGKTLYIYSGDAYNEKVHITSCNMYATFSTVSGCFHAGNDFFERKDPPAVSITNTHCISNSKNLNGADIDLMMKNGLVQIDNSIIKLRYSLTKDKKIIVKNSHLILETQHSENPAVYDVFFEKFDIENSTLLFKANGETYFKCNNLNIKNSNISLDEQSKQWPKIIPTVSSMMKGNIIKILEGHRLFTQEDQALATRNIIKDNIFFTNLDAVYDETLANTVSINNICLPK